MGSSGEHRFVRPARNLPSARAREGENLKNDLIAKLDALDEKVSQVEARSPRGCGFLQREAGSQGS